jgi:hypothetical protein
MPTGPPRTKNEILDESHIYNPNDIEVEGNYDAYEENEKNEEVYMRSMYIKNVNICICMYIHILYVYITQTI